MKTCVFRDTDPIFSCSPIFILSLLVYSSHSFNSSLSCQCVFDLLIHFSAEQTPYSFPKRLVFPSSSWHYIGFTAIQLSFIINPGGRVFCHFQFVPHDCYLMLLVDLRGGGFMKLFLDEKTGRRLIYYKNKKILLQNEGIFMSENCIFIPNSACGNLSHFFCPLFFYRSIL